MGIVINDNNGQKPQNPFIGCQVINAQGYTEIYDGEWKTIFTIKNQTNNSVQKIKEEEPYTLEVCNNVIVTMGGEDITASAISEGLLHIPSVSGDVVIKYDEIEDSGEGE